MDNIKDLYILGLPIDTPVGKLYPVKVHEYPAFIQHINTLVLDKGTLMYTIKQLVSVDDGFQLVLDVIKELDLFDFIKFFMEDDFKGTFPYILCVDLYEQHRELFKFCFKKDVINLIEKSKDFEFYKKTIIEMNDIQYEPLNPNPKIAKFDLLKRMMQQGKGEQLSFKAKYSSVLLFMGKYAKDLTLYQFNALFERIGYFKNYDITSIYRILDDKVDVVPWYADIEHKPKTMTHEQLEYYRQLKTNSGLQKDL